MTNASLKKFISTAPSSPGIYIFSAKGGKKILYIGKAADIKARLRSYLKTKDSRILKMLALAISIKTLETGSEIEALITESQCIKKYKPAFNIMLRDDKQFFYVGITKEEWPKIFITHQPTFFGPFTDGTALKTTLRHLRRIFPYCTCKKPHHNFCLTYHIGKCPRFCCLKDSLERSGFGKLPILSDSRMDRRIAEKKLYSKNIKAIKNILSGKKTLLLKHLETEMIKLGKEAARSDNRSERASLKEREKFQEAIELRDKIEKISRVFENARIIQNIPYYDISKNYSEKTSSDLGKILKLKKYPYRIEGYDVANIQGKYAVGAMVVFVDGKPDKNEYRRFKIRYQKNQKLLLQKHNDRGNIATIDELANDTAMLKEVLTRRFNHPEWPLADLIVVDGGKAQLSTTLAVVRSKFKLLNPKQIQNSKPEKGPAGPLGSFAGFKIPKIIALTKNEKHRAVKMFVQNKKEAVPLSKLPANVKNLLLHINSEAHRFATSYYRKLHRKKALRPN